MPVGPACGYDRARLVRRPVRAATSSGDWLSRLERTVHIREVTGSNPVSPTTVTSQTAGPSGPVSVPELDGARPHPWAGDAYVSCLGIHEQETRVNLVRAGIAKDTGCEGQGTVESQRPRHTISRWVDDRVHLRRGARIRMSRPATRPCPGRRPPRAMASGYRNATRQPTPMDGAVWPQATASSRCVASSA